MAGLGSNKQFTCDIPGCHQCFLSEDHLSPYLLRHDGDPKTSLLPVDQTPTPTTIFRKCQEAGLLQALQVENPFEETFRKAAEGIRSGSNLLDQLPLHLNAQESLNTPQVIIPGTENETTNREPTNRIVSPVADPLCLSLDPSPIIRREADTSDGKAEDNDSCASEVVVSNTHTNPVTIESAASTKGIQQTAETTDSSRSVQVLLRMPDGKLVQLSTLPVEPVSANGGSVPPNIPIIKVDAPPPESNGTETAVSLQKSMSLAKMKLKQALITNNCPAATAPSQNTNKNAKSNIGPQQHQTQTQPVQVPQSQPLQKSSTSSDDDPDVRRRKFLERNRAAAMRCREKKKTWVQELERNSSEMLRTNQHLEKEISLLRTEVAHLKTLLLAHKDCPVTKALAQGQSTLPGFITLPAPSTIPLPHLVNIAQPVNTTGGGVVRPVIVLNDPRSKRRRHTSSSDSSSSSMSIPSAAAKDAVNQSATLLKAVSAMKTTTSAPVTATPAQLAPVSKQAFILPKTGGGVAVAAPPAVLSSLTTSVHAWDKNELSHEKMQNRSAILSTNVIKVNPNVMDRDIEIIGVKAQGNV